MADFGLKILYKTVPGRFVLSKLINPKLSRRVGKYLDSPKSVKHIKGFVADNDIDLSEYEEVKYNSFNDFFSRRVKPEARPFSIRKKDFICPCDGKLSVYKINKGRILPIKQSSYTVEELVNSKEIASHYKNGYVLIFRLCVDNYHRYHYLDNCIKSDNYKIPGVLHTVRPIALSQAKVFVQNSREYTIMKTDNFGAVTQIEVGALLVGKIDNYHEMGKHSRGEEKGKFLYGGSTIVLLVEENTIEFKDAISKTINRGIETDVKFGETIAKSII